MDKSSVESMGKPGIEVSDKLIRVLYVDDEVGLFPVSKQFLELAGPFQVDSALSVEQALQKLRRQVYDAVVSDFRLPEKNGLQFLKKLRDEGNTIPFIMLTGKGMEEVAVQALNLGADYCVNKSLNPEVMFSELANDIAKAVIAKAVERSSAQSAAWLRQERLKAILDSSLDTIMITDLQSNIIECNREAFKLTGFSSKAEVIGKNVLDFVEERHHQRVSESLKKVLEQGTVKNVEFDLVPQFGRGLMGELSAGIVQDSVGNPIGMVIVVSDITDRKRSRNKLAQYSKRLEENQNFLENIFAAFPDAVTVCDLDGNIIKCNQETLDLHGYSSKNELIGVNLFTLMQQEDADRAKADMEKAKQAGTVKNVEYRMIGRDGKEFPAELSVGTIMDKWLNSLGFVVITKNITDRKRLQEQLVISEKLAAVGRLSASFSHDIRNPLAVIKNSACFLEMRLKETSDAKVLKHLRIMQEEINYASLMVNDVLDFTRRSPPILQEADLAESVRAAISSVSIQENVELVFEPCELSAMLFDPAQLQRVFTNLITNAVQAMPDGGKLTIQTAKLPGSVELKFTDTGVGINDAGLQKMFTPFFTTKPNGVGLGLSICKQIIENHGGQITVESEEGKGTTFTLKMPIRTSETQKPLSTDHRLLKVRR
jgi:two-component system NtrC family sensor kinase